MFQLVIIITWLALAHAGPPFLHNTKIFPELKIIGGQDIDIKHHPWQVSVRWLGSHSCGGSLVGDKWVITAAHCAANISRLSVNVGSTFMSSGGTEYKVNQFIVHPEYTDSEKDNDIAIIQLAQAVDDPNASVITLPSQGETLIVGTNISITGWGATEESSDSEILQAVVVPLISYDECALAYPGIITENMLCMGLMGVGGKDSCAGDSGGRAAINEVLYGIVSFGRGCGEPKYPGVYTNVASYVDWIRNIIEV